MLGWWKRNEGFEWREYVRTTILMRRQRRQERVDEAKAAAVAGLKEAGRAGASAGVRGLGWAGRALAAAGSWLGSGLYSGLSGIGRAPGGLYRRLVPPGASSGLVPANLAGPLLLIAAIGLVAAAYRAFVAGLDSEALLAAGVGLAGLALGLSALGADRSGWPAWARQGVARLPSLPAPPPVLIGAIIVIGLAGTGGWLAARFLGPVVPAGLLASLPLPLPASKPVAGMATATGGDTLRVANVALRLAGIEAPESDQRCTIPGRRSWRCGEAAQEALSRLLRGKHVSCQVSGSDEIGRALATCSAEGSDVAAALVRQGHVFAQPGFVSRYGAAEVEARTAKLGIWRGEAQRPADWRAKRWAEAKRVAPDGCPIKGAVGREGKVYVLPWSRDYERVSVRTARGERWFCSEQDARAAGWRAADRS